MNQFVEEFGDCSFWPPSEIKKKESMIGSSFVTWPMSNLFVICIDQFEGDHYCEHFQQY